LEDLGPDLKTSWTDFVEDAPRFEPNTRLADGKFRARMITEAIGERNAMSKVTRTTITIQSRQRIVVRPVPDSLVAWCAECGAEVFMLTPECVAGVLHKTMSEIDGLLQSGTLHSNLDHSGENLICGQSLSAASTEFEIQIEGENR
jgi:hypothetical protein